MRIAVLGAGSWGTTLAVLLSNKSHEVTLWSYRESDAERIRFSRENSPYLPGILIPQAVSVSSDLAEAVGGVDMIVAAVPSQFVRSVITAVPQVALANAIIVNVAKGIEIGTLMTMSEVFRDAIPGLPADRICDAVRSEPCRGSEPQIPTTVVAASTSIETARMVQQAFMVPYFQGLRQRRPAGRRAGGVAEERHCHRGGDRGRGGPRGQHEGSADDTGYRGDHARGRPMGAELRTFGGLSGIGDLMVTCMSRHSRNRHVGMEIGKRAATDRHPGRHGDGR